MIPQAIRMASLALLLITGPVTTADTLTEAEADVWSGEEAYWQYVNARDVDSFLTLWHEHFRGWPCGAPTTATSDNMRADISDWFTRLEREGAKTIIENAGIVLDEDFAITYVAATTTAAGATTRMKLVHTWRRTDDGWKIIGGMCGPLDA